MSRFLRIWHAPLLVLGLVGGCAASGEDPAASAPPPAPKEAAATAIPEPPADADIPASLDGSRWELAAATQGPLAEHALGSGITLFFGEGKVTGHGGCNSYGGDYTFDGRVLRIGTLTTTKRGCEDVAGEVERAWHAVLAQPLEVRRYRTSLTLWAPGGQSLRLGVAPPNPGTP